MAEEIYQFYQVHKINFRNQSDLIKEFLKQNLNVSCQNLSLEASKFSRNFRKKDFLLKNAKN